MGLKEYNLIINFLNYKYLLNAHIVPVTMLSIGTMFAKQTYCLPL